MLRTVIKLDVRNIIQGRPRPVPSPFFLLLTGMLTRDLFAVANLLVCYCVIWVVRGLGMGVRCASVLLLIIQCVNYGSHILSFVVIAYNSFL